MQTRTFRTKKLFHYTTVIVQKIPDFGYQSYDVFDLENMNSADCKAEFRVAGMFADSGLLNDVANFTFSLAG